MISSSLSSYWRAARAPRYSVVFAFPLLVSYELLAFVLSHGEVTGVRNGADVLLKSLFVALGGRYGLALFGIVIIGGGVAIAWRDLRRSGGIRPRYLLWMLGESVAYALVFGMVAGTLTFMLLPRLSMVGGVATGGFAPGIQGLPTQLMISLGAGIYEELLFRVVLVSALAWLGFRVFGWSRTAANGFAVVVGALIFSAFHYIGPYGEPLRLDSFTFRAIAGLLFSGLYLLRGFGITAWTHALYDVFLAVG
jgi:Type II CAAX prenyl endopeptidase Rce1-like